jgi:hypothetical protein
MAARHHRDIGELFLREFRPVAAADGFHDADDLASLLQPGGSQAGVHGVRKQRVLAMVRCPPRHQGAMHERPERLEVEGDLFGLGG